MSDKIVAPLPGVVLDINVKVGDKVGVGDVTFILEAMKMENEIAAEADGTVKSINANIGDTVNANDVVIELEV